MDQLFHSWTPAAETPHVRRVAPSAPFAWIAAGAKDLGRAAAVSLGHGAAFAVLGLALTMLTWDHPHLVTALASGFFLVAPFLAIGFYEMSRKLSRGEAPGYGDLGRAWRRNIESIGLFGLVLVLMVIAWERLSAIVFGLFFGSSVPDAQSLGAQILYSGEHLGFLVAYVGLGAVLAGVTFAISVVTVPMLIDRDVDPVTAIMTSMKVVAVNPLPMLVWAAVIVVLVLAGLATFLVGLMITLPIVAHGSWHAYRELVK